LAGQENGAVTVCLFLGKINPNKIIFGKPEGKGPLEIPRRRWEK
jgi:hypothetical protein